MKNRGKWAVEWKSGKERWKSDSRKIRESLYFASFDFQCCTWLYAYVYIHCAVKKKKEKKRKKEKRNENIESTSLMEKTTFYFYSISIRWFTNSVVILFEVNKIVPCVGVTRQEKNWNDNVSDFVVRYSSWITRSIIIESPLWNYRLVLNDGGRRTIRVASGGKISIRSDRSWPNSGAEGNTFTRGERGNYWKIQSAINRLVDRFIRLTWLSTLFEEIEDSRYAFDSLCVSLLITMLSYKIVKISDKMRISIAL